MRISLGFYKRAASQNFACALIFLAVLLMTGGCAAFRAKIAGVDTSPSPPSPPAPAPTAPTETNSRAELALERQRQILEDLNAKQSALKAEMDALDANQRQIEAALNNLARQQNVDRGAAGLPGPSLSPSMEESQLRELRNQIDQLQHDLRPRIRRERAGQSVDASESVEEDALLSTRGRSPASVAESFAPVDKWLRSLGQGNIAFNTPQRMNLKDSKQIDLVLGLASSVEELKKMIESQEPKETHQVTVAPVMEASLTGANFAITPVTPSQQAISATDATRWKWDVKPTTEGLQSLHLVLSVVYQGNGVSTPRMISTFDKTIVIQVTPGQRLSSFFENNWQWLWTVFLVPVAGWLWKKRRGQPVVNEKADEHAAAKSAGG